MGCGMSQNQQIKQKMAEFEIREPAKRIMVNNEECTLLMHINNIGPYYTEDIDNKKYSYFEHRFIELMTKEIRSTNAELIWETKQDFVLSVLRSQKLRKKMFNFIRRKGLDHHYRWTTWQALTWSPDTNFQTGLDQIENRRNLYSNLLRMDNREVEDIVNKDVLRTSRHKELFNSIDSIGTGLLYNVSKAIGCFYHDIGYVQGMNFIMAFVLEVSGMEEFESWNFIINFWNKDKNLYFGLYDVGFPLLYFLKFAFHQLLAERNPSLSQRIKKIGFPDEMWLSKWFLGMFTFAVTKDYLLRIFDYLLTTDMFGMVYIALLIADQIQADFFHQDSFPILSEYFQNPKKLCEKLNFYQFVKDLKFIEISKKRRLDIIEAYFGQLSDSQKPLFNFYFVTTKTRLENEPSESWENLKPNLEHKDMDKPDMQALWLFRPSKKDLKKIKEDVVSMTEIDPTTHEFNMDIILQRKMSILSSRFLTDGLEKNYQPQYAL
jgi:hypothetical protein